MLIHLLKFIYTVECSHPQMRTNVAPTGSDTLLCPKNGTKGTWTVTLTQDLTVTHTLFAATPTNTNFSD